MVRSRGYWPVCEGYTYELRKRVFLAVAEINNIEKIPTNAPDYPGKLLFDKIEKGNIAFFAISIDCKNANGAIRSFYLPSQFCVCNVGFYEQNISPLSRWNLNSKFCPILLTKNIFRSHFDSHGFSTIGMLNFTSKLHEILPDEYKKSWELDKLIEYLDGLIKKGEYQDLQLTPEIIKDEGIAIR